MGRWELLTLHPQTNPTLDLIGGRPRIPQQRKRVEWSVGANQGTNWDFVRADEAGCLLQPTYISNPLGRTLPYLCHQHRQSCRPARERLPVLLSLWPRGWSALGRSVGSSAEGMQPARSSSTRGCLQGTSCNTLSPDRRSLAARAGVLATVCYLRRVTSAFAALAKPGMACGPSQSRKSSALECRLKREAIAATNRSE